MEIWNHLRPLLKGERYEVTEVSFLPSRHQGTSTTLPSPPSPTVHESKVELRKVVTLGVPEGWSTTYPCVLTVTFITKVKSLSSIRRTILLVLGQFIVGIG